jgi:hypothetical protein
MFAPLTMLVAPRLLCADATLLVELKSFGDCFDCLPADMEFRFGARAADEDGEPSALWQLPVTTSDVGQTFNVPTNLLNDFNVVLTSSAIIAIGTAFGDTPQTILSGQFTHGTTTDVPSVERFVPVLGINLSGYQVTNITQTIDEIIVTPIPPRRFSIHGEHTIQIFGYVVPEPRGIVLLGFAIAVAYIRLRMRGAGC